MILPERSAFSQLIAPPLGRRKDKPRETGLTMVIDKGLGRNALQDLFETAGSYVDILKLGFGTGVLYPGNILKQKLTLARLYAVKSCTGGTLAEIALAQGNFEAMVDKSLQLGFTAIEISDGTMDIDPKTRDSAIQYVSKSGAMAVSEVGKKLDAFPELDEVVEQIDRDLTSGANLVILEGRESGENVGIYRDGGTVDETLLDALVQKLSTASLSRILWEAPKKNQQVALVKRFGQNVNLGNIQAEEVIALESLRLGLRSDTFTWTL